MSFGVNQRNAVSPTATPRIAPNVAAVGWSTARYIRAKQTAARMIPMAHFAWYRCFPGTTRVYAIPMSVIARLATGCDGVE